MNQVDVGEEEVLELAELPELTDTGDLGQQDGSLLEEHDLTNVLNEIPTIAFTDFFGMYAIRYFFKSKVSAISLMKVHFHRG